MSARVTLPRLLAALVLVGSLAVPALPTADAATATIATRGPARAVAYPSESTRAITLSLPSGAVEGDVLVASLGFGRSGGSAQPALTPPPGWTLVRRTDQGTVGALAVYWHVLAAGESGFTWTTDVKIGGAAFLAAFTGVDRAAPVDVSAGRTSTTRSSSLATPSVTTTVTGDGLLASYFAYNGGGRRTTWSPPTGMTELGDVNNGASRSGALAFAGPVGLAASGAKTATACG